MKFAAILGFFGLAAAATVPNDDQQNLQEPESFELEPRADRVARSAGGMLGSVLTDYDKKFTEWNKKILEDHDLYNIRLTQQEKVADVDIYWKQQSKCYFGCHWTYHLYKYKTPDNRTVHVFFAEEFLADSFIQKQSLSDPHVLFTGPDNSDKYPFQKKRGMYKLYFGYTYYEGELTGGEKAGSVFFVQHPLGFGPFQKRFSTSALTQSTLFVMKQAAKKGGKWAAGAIGSAIGGPIGSIAGILVKKAAADAYDRFSGDYLRYIG